MDGEAPNKRLRVLDVYYNQDLFLQAYECRPQWPWIAEMLGKASPSEFGLHALLSVPYVGESVDFFSVKKKKERKIERDVYPSLPHPLSSSHFDD